MATQHGVLGRRQALELGLPSDSIETLLRTGRWLRMYRGVYATIPGAVVHRVGSVTSSRHPYLLPPRTCVEATILDLAESSKTADEAFGWVCRAIGKGLTNTDRLHDAISQRSKLRWRH